MGGVNSLLTLLLMLMGAEAGAVSTGLVLLLVVFLDAVGVRLVGVDSFVVGGASLLGEAGTCCLVDEVGELRSSLVLFFLRKPREGIGKMAVRNGGQEETQEHGVLRRSPNKPRRSWQAASSKARMYTSLCCRTSKTDGVDE